MMLALLVVIQGSLLTGQEAVKFLPTPPSDRWTITTRIDYRVRLDGRYAGHADREIREVYRVQDRLPEGWIVEGSARILGNTKKDGIPVAARLMQQETNTFVLRHDGSVSETDSDYPRLRGFPTFPRGEIQPGAVWEAPIQVLVRPSDGNDETLRQIAAYRYLGVNKYRGEDAHFFEVQWAVRDSRLGLEGGHKVSLVVDAESGSPIMARDSFIERWTAHHKAEEREGFALIFWDGVPPLDVEDIGRRFAGISDSDVGGSGFAGPIEGAIEDGIILTETPQGLSVTLYNLHFLPDRAEILPEDRYLLDELARLITDIPGRTVIVRGHTADIGLYDQQYALSEERAKVVADEMTIRGIDPRRLVYEGVGADEPLAPNDSDEGRRMNRRVEFVILED